MDMANKQQVITSIGIGVLEEQIDRKTVEIMGLLEEIRTQRGSQSSTDDNTEIAIITTRYEKVIQERNDLQGILNYANVVDVTKITDSKVVFGSVVTIQNVNDDTVYTYRVVSPIESDISKGMISYESPIGKAMIGLVVGDSFEYRVRNGIEEFEILKIQVVAI